MNKLVVQERDGKWIVGMVNPGTNTICCQYHKVFDTASEAAEKMHELEEHVELIKVMAK